MTEKVTPVGTDQIPINDVAGGNVDKYIQIANLSKMFDAIIKPTDETKDDDTVLTDDDALVFTPSINTTYFIQLFVFYEAAGGAGLKVAMTVPTGATITWMQSQDDWQMFTSPSSQINATTSIGTSVTGLNHFATYLKLDMASTAGDVHMQWAQFFGGIGDTTMQKGTAMLIWEAS